jgi:hypothetical protein
VPIPEQILNGLGEIATTWRWLAVIWHAYLAVLVIGLALGVRPPRRVSGILVGLPLLSVSALAWWSGNPFNGSVFGLVGVLVLAISARLGETRVIVAPPWAWVPGVLMVIFGWLYPHFLKATSFVAYLYSAPLGLIPCPTLSMVVGLGLLMGGFGSRGWTLIVGITGLFYGLFGTVRLGVSLDWVLVVGALWLVLMARGLKRVDQGVNPGGA